MEKKQIHVSSGQKYRWQTQSSGEKRNRKLPGQKQSILKQEIPETKHARPVADGVVLR